MSGQEPVLQVAIFRDGSLVGTMIFPPGSYRLGSALNSDLRLEHPSVDVEHAVLYFQNGKAVLQDHSRGGVFVNGQRISVCEVSALDEIRCGPFMLKARIAAPTASGKHVAPPEVEALLSSGRSARPPPSAGPVRHSAPPAPGPASIDPRGARSLPPGARPVAPKPAPSRAVNHVPSRQGPVPSMKAPVPAVGRIPSLRPQPRGSGQLPVQSESVPSPGHSRRRTAAIRAEGYKGPPHLHFELSWGNVLCGAHCFGPDKKPVIASDSEGAKLPLYGFTLPSPPFAISQSTGQGYRLYVPPHARAERLKSDGRFHPVNARDLEVDGTGHYLSLSDGMEARLVEGQMALLAYVAPRPKRVRLNPFRGLPWEVLILIVAFSSTLLSFILYGPKPPDVAEFAPKKLPPVAVRLLAPPPPPPPEEKKEEPKKVEEPEKPKEIVEEKKEKPVIKPEHKRPPPRHQKVAKVPPEEKVVTPPPPPPPESKALKALAKLSAAGPATGDILAAVDKLGSGPGSKKVKNSNYKLSGLIGKAPIANAGLGTFGLGGGGRGGGTVLGSEILHGKGGGGVGALGVRGIGHGAVAGTVTRASARTVSVQGSVDREAVAKTVNAHLQEVRACYERALIKEPSLSGKVVLEWTISLTGTVVSAKIKNSTLRNGTVEGCIVQDLKTWKFPPAKGGLVIVSYPFLFNSVGY